MSESNSIPQYRSIPGFHRYRVGDNGSVWVFRAGRRYRNSPWRPLKQEVIRGGYLRVVLNPGCHRRLIHRLVLDAFRGPCPEGMECRHLDGTRTNNALSNLCWGTRAENVEDKKRHGTEAYGERQWKARLTTDLVRTIRAEYAAGGTSHPRLARKYGVHQSTIGHMLRGTTWKHVA